MSSLKNIEVCLEGRYRKHEQVGNKYLREESLMIQHKRRPECSVINLSLKSQCSSATSSRDVCRIGIVCL